MREYEASTQEANAFCSQSYAVDLKMTNKYAQRFGMTESDLKCPKMTVLSGETLN